MRIDNMSSRYTGNDVSLYGWCGDRHGSYVCTQPKGHHVHEDEHGECSLDGDKTYARWSTKVIEDARVTTENLLEEMNIAAEY